MVVTHYCHHFGFCAPYPLWCKWWSNTITMTLVLIHHTQYGPDGSQTPLPHFGSHTPYPIWPRWWSHTIAIILVSMHHTHYGSDGSQTPLPHFGSYTPFFTCPRWWSHTIAIILVSMHHTYYGSDGSQTPLPHFGSYTPFFTCPRWWSPPLPSFWFPCTIPTMAQMVVKHHCHILVLTHHSSHAQDGGHTLLPSFWFPCTIPTMVQMVVKHHYDGFGSHTPYPIWPRWWSHTIAIILVSMHHTHYGANGGQTPLR